MPAIVDPGWAGWEADLDFMLWVQSCNTSATKQASSYPAEQRARSEVEQWLFWQMGGLGPMAGQAAHFRNYKADKIEYAVDRYTNEVIRLYGVMDGRLADRDFLAGDFSIADMACWPWIRGYKAYGIELRDFANLRAWFKRVGARPAVERAANIGKDRSRTPENAPKVRFNRGFAFSSACVRSPLAKIRFELAPSSLNCFADVADGDRDAAERNRDQGACPQGGIVAL